MSANWIPSGAWKAKFRDALVNAFLPTDMAILISDYFSPENFFNITPVGPATTYQYQIFQLIEYARMNDWLLDLVAAASERRPKNQQLADLAASAGLTALGTRLDNPTGKPFEQIILENAQFIDPVVFAQKLPALQGQVCWVDVPGGGGTGFLVGPDLVLTNDHVVQRVKQGLARWQDIRCIFDFKYDKAADGTPITRKNQTLPSYALAAQPLVDSLPVSPYDSDPALGDASAAELDYALLRLADSVGELPAGPDTADSQAPNLPRGWIDTAVAPPPLTAGNQVFLLQHNRGGPQKLSVGTVKSSNQAGTRLRYDANSEEGSSGSPCFNADLQLVALHHAYDPAVPRKWNQAVPLTALRQAWQDRKIAVP